MMVEDESSATSSPDPDATDTNASKLVIECVKDSHPSYFVFASRSEMVIFYCCRFLFFVFYSILKLINN